MTPGDPIPPDAGVDPRGSACAEGVSRRHFLQAAGAATGLAPVAAAAQPRDGRDWRIVNANLAEYHVPVNADIGAIDVASSPSATRS